MVVYPGSSLHHVTPVTRGVRLAAFFWVQSMVRDDGQRTLLFDLDMAINKVNQALPNHASRRGIDQLLSQPIKALRRGINGSALFVSPYRSSADHRRLVRIGFASHAICSPADDISFERFCHLCRTGEIYRRKTQPNGNTIPQACFAAFAKVHAAKPVSARCPPDNMQLNRSKLRTSNWRATSSHGFGRSFFQSDAHHQEHLTRRASSLNFVLSSITRPKVIKEGKRELTDVDYQRRRPRGWEKTTCATKRILLRDWMREEFSALKERQDRLAF